VEREATVPVRSPGTVVSKAYSAAQGLHGLQAAQGLHGFAAAHGLQGLLAAQGLQGFAAAQGLQGLFAAQGLQALQDAICTEVSVAWAASGSATAAPLARVATLRATAVFFHMRETSLSCRSESCRSDLSCRSVRHDRSCAPGAAAAWGTVPVTHFGQTVTACPIKARTARINSA
jgi:hypothetical protein